MRSRGVSIGIWIVLLALSAFIVARARYTADLLAFLPRTPTAAQRLLVDQLREGPASRLILLAIEGGDAPTRAQLSRALATRLSGDGQFQTISNGEAVGLEADREFIFAHRYLLSDRVNAERFTVGGLQTAIRDSIDLLSSPMGLLAKDLFLRDPTGETLQVLTQLDRSTRPASVDGAWVSPDGQRALLVAETHSAGSDTDGQEHAMRTIRAAFAAAQEAIGTARPSTTVLRMSGPGVFAVQARNTIEHEAVRLSILSSVLIAALLLLVYRSVPALLLGMLPVASGALAGVAAVALGFGVVHGVTLGFGVTLIGESVDYSVYLFIQARRNLQPGHDSSAWLSTLWPTIRLGMLTSVCGFASLLPSGFPGLAQLGLYSIAGLVSAALVTRFVLPGLLPGNLALSTAEPLGRAFAHALTPLRRGNVLIWLLPALAAILLFADRGRLWNRELSALSPVSAANQALDADLRADLGAPDVRTLIVISGPNTDAVLRASESVGQALEPLVSEGVLAGFESPSRYLPSAATQALRQASVPAAQELRRRLTAAVATLPIRAVRLEPFLEDAAEARAAPLLYPADLKGTSLASGFGALMMQDGMRWNALLPLQARRSGLEAFTIDIGRVSQALRNAAPPGVDAVVLDLKRESDALYSSYLSEAIRLSLAGLLAILVLLLISLRSVVRVGRVVAPLVIAVLVVIAGFALAGHRLTILHLIGMLLIIAVGSNYALFFDRRTSDPDPEADTRTLASLVVANLTTVTGFGVLSFSTVPVLSALGSTVAPGAFLALVFSAALARPQATAVRSK